MHWAAEYIGIPYMQGCDTRQGADCWGLVRLVLREVAHMDMPMVFVGEEGNDRAIRKCFDGWRRAEGDLQELDIVTMRNALGHHVGIVAKGPERLILHCDEPISCIIPFDKMGLLGYHDFKVWRRNEHC